jgi:hypothetical protein
MSYFSPVHMQALDYVGVLSTKTSPAAVIMEKICLVTFTLSLQWHACNTRTFPPQLSSSSPWHTGFHPTMLLFLLFPTLLPFHCFLSTSWVVLQYSTLQSSDTTTATPHRRPGTCRALRGAYNCFFFLFSWLVESSPLTYVRIIVHTIFCVQFSGRGEQQLASNTEGVVVTCTTNSYVQ